MGYAADYTGSYVAGFHLGGNRYEHKIHCNTDDRVECTDLDGNVVLTFTANCEVLQGNKNGTHLGRISMNTDNTWSFLYGQDYEKQLDSHSRDLLKFEVEISKLWVAGNL